MPVWNVPDIEVEPFIALINWMVFDYHGEQHIAGYNFKDDEGRVSSKIVEWDYPNRQATTNSGRIYKLLGIPQLSDSAKYVFERWAIINIVSVEDLKDVSQEISDKMPKDE
jgi:hypothetical protein